MAAMRIAFIHPNLGIGGAEKLIVDAAVGLQKLGHHVEIYTSHHDKTRCFEETRDGTLSVHEIGSSLVPQSVGGHFMIVCAILRQFHLVATLLFSIFLNYIPLFGLPSSRPYKDSQDWSIRRTTEPFDVFFVDQLSAGIPLLRWLGNTRVVFYCHFPDLLLSPNKDKSAPSGLLRSLYRLPIDRLEESTTGEADSILVNSFFTAQVFRDTFTTLARTTQVVYPGINVAEYQTKPDLSSVSDLADALHDRPFFISINRFQTQKNVILALRAFAKVYSAASSTNKPVFIIAGGYDSRLPENIATLAYLQKNASSLSLPHAMLDSPQAKEAAVLFLPNLSNNHKLFLLHHSSCLALLYTPTNEHFGIVPLEAMSCGVPVVACDSGGPLETIEDSLTGYLRPPKEEAWVEVLSHLYSCSTEDRKAMGEKGRKRVEQEFGLEKMAKQLEVVLEEAIQAKGRKAIFAENGTIKFAGAIAFSAMCVGLLSVIIKNRQPGEFQSVGQRMFGSALEARRKKNAGQ